MPAPAWERDVLYRSASSREQKNNGKVWETGAARITEVVVDRVAQNQNHRSELGVCKRTISKYNLDHLSIIELTRHCCPSTPQVLLVFSKLPGPYVFWNLVFGLQSVCVTFQGLTERILLSCGSFTWSPQQNVILSVPRPILGAQAKKEVG